MTILMMLTLLVGIVMGLGLILFFLLRMNQSDSVKNAYTEQRRRMVRILAVRVGLALLLCAGLLVAHRLGYIQPAGLPG